MNNQPRAAVLSFVVVVVVFGALLVNEGVRSSDLPVSSQVEVSHQEKNADTPRPRIENIRLSSADDRREFPTFEEYCRATHEIKTIELFQVRWDRENHVCIGTWQGHRIWTDQFRVMWRDEFNEWHPYDNYVAVYLGPPHPWVLIEEKEGYIICIRMDVDRLEVLDNDGNMITYLR